MELISDSFIPLSLLLITFYSLQQFRNWGHHSLSLENPTNLGRVYWRHFFSSPPRYTFFATLYCLINLSIYSAVFAATSRWIEDNTLWAAAPFLVALVQITLLPALPFIGTALQKIRFCLQRHSFNPAFPNELEEQLLHELITQPSSFQPATARTANVLANASEEGGQIHTRLQALEQIPAETPAYNLLKLRVLGQQLHDTLAQTGWFPGKNQVRELADIVIGKCRAIDNGYKPTSPCKNTLSASEDPQEEIESLLFCCYLAITRLVLRTQFHKEARLTAFRRFGLQVNAATAYPLTLFYKLVYCQKKKVLGLGADKGPDRRRAERIHCYRHCYVQYDDIDVHSDSAIVSTNGACLPINSNLPIGANVIFYIEGFGSIGGNIIKNQERKLCVAFDKSADNRPWLQMFLYRCNAINAVG